MKNILLIACILILSCNSQNNNTDKRFFDYDSIDYYTNTITEEETGSLYDHQSRSAIDSLKMGVILRDIPEDIHDLGFINKLEKMGYKKSIIDKAKFADLDKLFVEKKVPESIFTSCIYVYRDILIFKKKGKVTGTAKICFDCMANEIQGSKYNTENFGQDGDYSKLEQILKD